MHANVHDLGCKYGCSAVEKLGIITHTTFIFTTPTPLPGHPACTNTSYSMESQKAMIRALTWNVGGTGPRDNNKSKQEIISSVTKKICDGLKDGALLVIGIQEVIPPKQSSNRRKDTLTRTQEWVKCFQNCDPKLRVL